MDHFEHLFPKFSVACYTVRWTVQISNINILKSIYYEYFYSILNYGIIFGCNSSNSRKIFALQKKSSKLWLVHNQDPHVCLFKQLEILPVPCQYMFSLMSFIINNQDILQTNSSIYSINKRNKHHLHRPDANLSCFQKSIFCAGINIFNSLPPSVIVLKNDKATFKTVLRTYLYTHTPLTL